MASSAGKKASFRSAKTSGRTQVSGTFKKALDTVSGTKTKRSAANGRFVGKKVR